MKDTRKKVWLICTGLGKVNRGFETHIISLGKLLQAEKQLSFNVDVIGSRQVAGLKMQACWNIGRSNKLATWFFKSSTTRFNIEQLTFFFSLALKVLIQKPGVIYLAEYNLYCYLFKLRNFLKLQFHLVHYTGGLAAPGLFNKQLDFVHHVSPRMIPIAAGMGIPENRQHLIPHFIDDSFKYDDDLIASLRAKAGKKKIALSVGAINSTFKQADTAVKFLAPHAAQIFPVFIGEVSEETAAIENLLQEYFGDGYFLGMVNHAKIGSYYAAANFFIMCSAQESFGLVFIEAMWHGIRVIAHEDEVTKFVLGDHACYVNSHEVDSAMRKIDYCISSLPAYTACEMIFHQHVLRSFSWSALKVRYIKLFNTVFE